jgi:hypothetical protein
MLLSRQNPRHRLEEGDQRFEGSWYRADSWGVCAGYPAFATRNEHPGPLRQLPFNVGVLALPLTRPGPVLLPQHFRTRLRPYFVH